MKDRRPNAWGALGVAVVFSALILAIGGVHNSDFFFDCLGMSIALWLVIQGSQQMAYKAGFEDGFDMARPKTERG